MPGIGRKGAQRLVLELKDRLGPAVGAPPSTDAATPPVAPAPWAEQVSAALVSLGWGTREAAAALEAVAPQAAEMIETSGMPDVAGLLRVALRSLDRP